MIYNADKPTDRVRATQRFNALMDKRVMFELTDKTIRTLRQNRYIHLIMGWFALEHGYSLQFVKDEYYKKQCSPEIFVTEIECKFTGERKLQLKSTTDCTKEEITLATERFRNWSAENGTYLPTPDEKQFLQEIEYEMNRIENKKYL